MGELEARIARFCVEQGVEPLAVGEVLRVTGEFLTWAVRRGFRRDQFGEFVQISHFHLADNDGNVLIVFPEGGQATMPAPGGFLVDFIGMTMVSSPDRSVSPIIPHGFMFADMALRMRAAYLAE